MHRLTLAPPLLLILSGLAACDPAPSSDGADSVDAAPVATQHRPHLQAAPGMKLLIVEKKGPGQGIVRGPDFVCDADCPYFEAEYPLGSPISLTAEAVPADDHFSRFAAWGVDCTGNDPAICNLSFDRSRKVEATFDLDGQLRVNRIGVSGGRVIATRADGSPAGIDCGEQCVAGYGASTSIKLSANPVHTTTGDIKLLRWGGACFGAQADCTLDIAGTHVEVNAEFRNALTIQPQGGGAITYEVAKRNDDDPDEYVVQCGSDCEGLYTANDEVIVVAKPAPGFDLVSWGDGCTPLPADRRMCKVKMDAPRTLRPVAKPDTMFEVRTEPLGAGTVLVTRADGTTVTCTPNAAHTLCTVDRIAVGSKVTFTATGDTGHLFASWEGCEREPSQREGTCSAVINGYQRVKAFFDTKYKLEAKILGEHPLDARITVSGQGVTCRGADCDPTRCRGACVFGLDVAQTVTVNVTGFGHPIQCWQFDRWEGACTGTGRCTVFVDNVKKVSVRWKRGTTGCPGGPH